MPLKFWKKEKADEKPKEGKAAEGTRAAKAEPEEETVEVEAAPAPAAPSAPEVAPSRPAPRPEGVDPTATVDHIHGGLVALGLTIPATKGIFGKRLETFPGGRDGFLHLYGAEPYKAVTQVLAAWLAIRASVDFEPQSLLADVNPRLSSFGMSIELHDLSWLDQELGLRKARLRLGDQEKVVRFKDPRDFLKGVNDLLASKRVSFLELETWSDEIAFLLVREPNWAALASTELVVVKDHQTATGGECGECGAKVGKYWNDCLSCGALFA